MVMPFSFSHLTINTVPRPPRPAPRSVGVCTLASDGMGKPMKEIATIVAERAFPLSARGVANRIPRSAEWVLIGEVSHGTREFYELRAEITKVLIEERGFNAIAAEADFPDAFRANLWARGLSQDKSAEEALSDFKRFPTWMWCNKTVKNFLEWLRDYNLQVKGAGTQNLGKSVGFYGLDVYSLSASTQAVIDYLKRTNNPEAAKIAKERYSCFDRYGADAAMYGLLLRHGAGPSCEDAAVQELLDMLKMVRERTKKAPGKPEQQEWDFAAQANAMVVKDAESYYRNMYFKDDITWNIRDRHMVETAWALKEHLKRYGNPTPKIVIWAHNSHLGDARATDMGLTRGEVNVGHLLRERCGDSHPDCVANLGFTTHSGTVAAADDWDDPVQNMRVNPSLPGSYENIMHSTQRPAFGLQLTKPAGPTNDGTDSDALHVLRAELAGPRLERAIGVIYRPDTERFSHYFKTYLPDQFDILMHIDKTSALEPLFPGDHFKSIGNAPDPPETFPFAV